MKDHKIWAPLKKIDNDKYLYHYTSVEKAIKILFYNTLQFGNIASTNDIFEQKPKLSFSKEFEDDVELINKEKIIEKYFLEHRNKIQILCFSQDSHTPNDDSTLSKYLKLANVIGRGFALPRMWAQYATNNEGVCFIINKQKLIDKLDREGFVYINRDVEYVQQYSTFQINSQDIELLYNKIQNKAVDVMAEMMRDSSSKYVRYNYFSKLNDWSTENEYRILILYNGPSNEKAKIKDAFDFIEAMIIGNNTSREYGYILSQIIKDKCPEIEIRQIIFDSIITSVQEI